MSEQSDWFQVFEVEEDVFVIEEPGHVQSFFIRGKTKSALLDTGMGFRNIHTIIEPLLCNEIVVLNTHWHFDHVGGNVLFNKIGISPVERHLLELTWPTSLLTKIYVNPCLSEGLPFPTDFKPERYEVQGIQSTFCVTEGDEIDLGGRVLEVISTPGHTYGSLSFLDKFTNSLFSGDLIYRGTLFAHFEDSDLTAYMASLNKLLRRSDEFRKIYPSHNGYPLEKEFLNLVLEGFSRMGKEDQRPEIIEDWGEPIYKYLFDGFSILTKMPGSKGVKLFSSG